MTRLAQAGRAGAQLGAAARGVVAWARGRATLAGGVVLAYHDVLDDGAPLPHYAVSLSRFRQHLDLVARLGLRVVPLHELSAAQGAGEDLSGMLALAFDDALLGVHRNAAPELAVRGLPAALHVVSDRLGVDPPWWPGSQRTMTRDELVEAVSAGLDVSAHGSSHACLPCLDDPDLRRELSEPRAWLEDLLGRPVDELAYPYGHYDERVRDAVRSAGYTTAYSFTNGRVLSGADPWQLPRFTMHEGLTPLRLLHQLSRRPQDWPDQDRPAVHPHRVG